MANLSPNQTNAIQSVAQHLEAAAQAASGLDSSASHDLLALLRVASGEAGRLRKEIVKTASKKSAPTLAKKPSKSESIAAIKTAAPSKGRRKSAAANGAAH